MRLVKKMKDAEQAVKAARTVWAKLECERVTSLPFNEAKNQKLTAAKCKKDAAEQGYSEAKGILLGRVEKFQLVIQKIRASKNPLKKNIEIAITHALAALQRYAPEKEGDKMLEARFGTSTDYAQDQGKKDAKSPTKKALKKALEGLKEKKLNPDNIEESTDFFVNGAESLVENATMMLKRLEEGEKNNKFSPLNEKDKKHVGNARIIMKGMIEFLQSLSVEKIDAEEQALAEKRAKELQRMAKEKIKQQEMAVAQEKKEKKLHDEFDSWGDLKEKDTHEKAKAYTDTLTKFLKYSGMDKWVWATNGRHKFHSAFLLCVRNLSDVLVAKSTREAHNQLIDIPYALDHYRREVIINNLKRLENKVAGTVKQGKEGKTFDVWLKKQPENEQEKLKAHKAIMLQQIAALRAYLGEVPLE